MELMFLKLLKLTVSDLYSQEYRNDARAFLHSDYYNQLLGYFQIDADLFTYHIYLTYVKRYPKITHALIMQLKPEQLLALKLNYEKDYDIVECLLDLSTYKKLDDSIERIKKLIEGRMNKLEINVKSHAV